MNTLGVVAENFALSYLRGQGLQLIERNFSCKLGEIDLIMQAGEVLVFVEVRQRKNANFGTAAASITPKKQHKLTLTAQVYLSRYPKIPACRFDALVITGKEVEWLKNII